MPEPPESDNRQNQRHKPIATAKPGPDGGNAKGTGPDQAGGPDGQNADQFNEDGSGSHPPGGSIAAGQGNGRDHVDAGGQRREQVGKWCFTEFRRDLEYRPGGGREGENRVNGNKDSAEAAAG